MPNNINIDKVKGIIREKHTAFMKKWGHLIEKTEADSNLKLVKIDSKLKLIFKCLKEETVIDGYKTFLIHEEKVQDATSYVAYCLYKNNHNIEVVATNDGIILISGRGASELGLASRFENEHISCSDADTFEWNDFAITLVEFIHSSIYRRKDLAMCNLFGGI